jgi:transposase
MMPGAEKMSRYRIDGGDMAALSGVLSRARAKAEQLGKPVRVLSCYEAGLDGHWLHRWLTTNGIVNYEIDASSIEVSRRARRAKTDRIDLAQLMRAFLAYQRGEVGVCSMVRVPTPEDEDRKRRTRERERLLKERTRAQQPDQGTAAWSGHPRRHAVEAELSVGSRADAHRRRACPAAAFERRDPPRA